MLRALAGPLAKGVISEGHRYLGINKAGVFSVSAVHGSPLLSEYFASALISLEIKFTSMLLNVNFFCRKYSTMSELIINI